MSSAEQTAATYTVSKNARGRPSDSPEVRISKTLSYILRHGAKKEGLDMRSDGYVKVDEMLARPKLEGVSLEQIQRIVKDNEKQRFQLLLEPVHTKQASGITVPTDVWWIRANQGHSVQVESLELQDIVSPELLPVAVHGTSLQAWESISKQGLSRMKRNHIHLATGLPSSGVKSGMRPHAQVLVYINVGKAMSAGLRFQLSANGVVLSEGDENGFILPEFFERVDFNKTKPKPPRAPNA